LLRVVATLSSVCVLAQPILAGGYLDGTFDFLDYHANNAEIIALLLLVQILAAVLYRWPGRGSSMPLTLTITELVLVVVQMIIGYRRVLAVHVPLGVLIVILALHVCVWVYRPAARRAREPRRARVRAEGRVDEPVA
jgi:hypothetical protein